MTGDGFYPRQSLVAKTHGQAVHQMRKFQPGICLPCQIDLPAAKRFGYGGVERNQIKTISGVYAIQSVTKQKGQMGRVAAGQGTGGFDASDIAVGSVDRQPQASGAALGFGELLAECCAKAR